MGRIKELIKSFINPAPQAKEFSELALESGVSEKELKELNASIGGIDWAKFAREQEEPKKGRNPKVSTKESQVQQVQERVETEKDLGMDR